MLKYPLSAITVKTISKFDYNKYLAIAVNMLKYNHDSSATMRLISCFTDMSNDIIEDLRYKTIFSLSNLDFVTIDRFNGFLLSKIPDLQKEEIDNTIYTGIIKGYSKYTDSFYDMVEVRDKGDFMRHSYPVDMFLGPLTYSNGYELKTLQPYVKTNIDMKIEDSIITISPWANFNHNLFYNGKTVDIVIYGIDIAGNLIEETVTIDSMYDIQTKREFSFVTGVMLEGTTGSVDIVIYPYITGLTANWDYPIIDRESLDRYRAIVEIDKDKKQVLFKIENPTNNAFPKTYDIHKVVDLNLPEEFISSYFIDNSNKVIYVLTVDGVLYTFPLIIPTTYSKFLDNEKTEYQAIRVEYYENCTSEEYDFFVFPSHKSNGVESLNIFIDGEEYASDLLLDLFRYNIDTNRITIPFSVLFKNRTSCHVKFSTYGKEESHLILYLDRSNLEPLYIKDLTFIPYFSKITPDNYILPHEKTNNTEYIEEYEEDNWITEDSILLKLSSVGNIMIDGRKIVNVFNSFYYDNSTGTIITSDTITGLSGLANDTSLNEFRDTIIGNTSDLKMIQLDTARVGLAAAGMASAGDK